MMFRFPVDVDGWLSDEEARELHRLASGARVLEIGSYCGKSTIALAQSATAIVSVDPHDGRGTPQPRSTLAEFRANLRRYGVSAETFVGTSDDVCPTIAGPFDLAFIDGAHDIASVRKDAAHASRLVIEGGTVVFHDYRNPAHPDVTRVADEYLMQGAKVVSQVGHLLACTRIPYEAKRPKVKVLLGQPMRPGEQVHAGAALAFYGTACSDPGVSISRFAPATSVLPFTFDTLWLTAIRGDFTHFGMLHDDVCPNPNWLGILLAECDRLNADMVAAVVPLKDGRGLTSTAIDDTGDVWSPRRLSLHEVFQLPETFTHPRLLLNTGCWVADLSKPWVRKEIDGTLAVSFHQRNKIARKDGQLEMMMRSEDWEFSRSVREHGGDRLYATRKVKLYHQHTTFHNTAVWGTAQSDPCHAQVASVEVAA